MISLRARLVMASLRARRSKRFYRDPDVMIAELGRRQRRSMTMPPRRFRHGAVVRSERIGGITCRSIEPVTTPGPRILHLHGGAFVEQPERHHWRFLRWLAQAAGASVVAPIYPLCPVAESESIRRAVRRAYDCTVADHAGPVVVSGDSAGGLLAVDLARTLSADGARTPDGLVLLSPWLDLGVTDERSRRIDPRDPELDIDGLRIAGRWYAGGPLGGRTAVAPLTADLSGLPPTLVCTGTRDILNPDADRLKRALVAAGVPVEVQEYPGMFHNWLMHTIPEGARARRRLLGFLCEIGVVASPDGGDGV